VPQTERTFVYTHDSVSSQQTGKQTTFKI